MPNYTILTPPPPNSDSQLTIVCDKSLFSRNASALSLPFSRDSTRLVFLLYLITYKQTSITFIFRRF